jgi:hypothetical protein
MTILFLIGIMAVPPVWEHTAAALVNGTGAQSAINLHHFGGSKCFAGILC